MTGLPKATGETPDSLKRKVAETLALSGETVAVNDFTAVHRNGNLEKTTSEGKKIPPSVTVKFHSISKKDSVLRNYKNFDNIKKVPRPTKVFQSLSPHYASLRRSIVKFFNVDNASHNLGKQLKWVTYQSPTAGLVVKLKSDEYLRDIHVIDDFYFRFSEATRNN